MINTVRFFYQSLDYSCNSKSCDISSHNNFPKDTINESKNSNTKNNNSTNNENNFHCPGCCRCRGPIKNSTNNENSFCCPGCCRCRGPIKTKRYRKKSYLSQLNVTNLHKNANS